MRKLTFITSVATSVVLGIISPFIAELGGHYADPASDHGVLYVWFYAMPIALAKNIWIEQDIAMLALAMVVYAVQYLLALMALRAALALIQVAFDFSQPHRHRTGLTAQRGTT